MSLNNRRHETTESGKMNRNFAGEHPAAIRAALLRSHMQSPVEPKSIGYRRGAGGRIILIEY